VVEEYINFMGSELVVRIKNILIYFIGSETFLYTKGVKKLYRYFPTNLVYPFTLRVLYPFTLRVMGINTYDLIA